jgi:hypothetical protein
MLFASIQIIVQMDAKVDLDLGKLVVQMIEHLKQDIRSHVEDMQDMLKV